MTIALAGSFQDGTITNENQYNTDWDGDITYAVRESDEEWVVEVLIPWTLAAMKNPGTGRRTVGVVFDRVIGQTQERQALQGLAFTRPRYLSDFPRVEIDQYTGSLFHVLPYVSAASDWIEDAVDLKLGADLLWKPSGTFQLTAALNPDFGQVEADELVVNFDAIEVLFSDKRPFFAENQALFDVRVAGTDRLIYTRRVGGARDDDPALAAELDGALKLNGSVGRLDYGSFAALERDYADDLGGAFAAQRLRYGLGSLTLGALSTWTDRPFLDRDAQVHSADFVWRPNPRFILQGQALGSSIDDPIGGSSGDGEVLQAFYTPTPDWQHEMTLVHLSDDLDFNDLGFQQRAGVKRANLSIARRYRDFPADDPRAGVLWRARPEGRWNHAGESLGHYFGLFREAQQRSGALVTTQVEVSADGVDDLISRGNGNVNVEPRLVALKQTWHTPRIGKWRTFAAGVVLQEGNDDYAYELETKLEYFPRNDLTVSARAMMHWSRDWLIWVEDSLLASYHRKRAFLASDLNWFPAPSQELRVKLQWLAIDAYRPTPLRISASGDLVESADPVAPLRVNNFGLQIRYRWTFAPQSDLYVVYGRGGIVFEDDDRERGLGDLLSSAFELRDSDQLIVKARYRF